MTLEAQLGLVGGMMGLFTGFSILSGVEIIYYIIRFIEFLYFSFNSIQVLFVSRVLQDNLKIWKLFDEKGLEVINVHVYNQLMHYHVFYLVWIGVTIKHFNSKQVNMYLLAKVSLDKYHLWGWPVKYRDKNEKTKHKCRVKEQIVKRQYWLKFSRYIW